MNTLRFLGPALLAFLAGCASTPESRIQRNPEAFAQLPPAVQERVRRGQVYIGDSESVVLLALGEPARRMERLDQRTGLSQVWIYARSAPRFSFGIGVGSYGRHSATRVGVGTSTGGYKDDEAMRVEFRQGRVVRVDYRKG
ncbi:MAG: hypothetical protein C0502_07905 [Opitutus sp.]|nr:hypothetical protein [Opitutus sp.]